MWVKLLGMCFDYIQYFFDKFVGFKIGYVVLLRKSVYKLESWFL